MDRNLLPFLFCLCARAVATARSRFAADGLATPRVLAAVCSQQCARSSVLAAVCSQQCARSSVLAAVCSQQSYNFKVLSMLTTARFIITVSLILLIVPQTNTENALLRAFNNSNLFKNYGEAKTFLLIITWLSIVFYLLLTYFATIL